MVTFLSIFQGSFDHSQKFFVSLFGPLLRYLNNFHLKTVSYFSQFLCTESRDIVYFVSVLCYKILNFITIFG